MLAEAASGDGGLLLFTGEAGIGKTTVLHAVASEARRRGLAVHVAGTPADPDRAALSPWVQLFDEHLQGLGAEEVRRIVGPAASALSLLGLSGAVGAAERTPRVGDDGRPRLLRQLAEVWQRAADAAPGGLLLGLDDLHWADLGTVLLLIEMAGRLAGRRLVVVATLRPGDPASGPVAEALGELPRLARLTLPLTGLDDTALAALTRAAGLTATPDLVATLARRTDGNPFFVTQLLRMLTANVANAQQVLAVEVPVQVVEVVRRRLARLPAATAGLLEVAAVLGAGWTVENLAAAAGRDLGAVLSELEPAVTSGLLADPGAGQWRFVHALVRDAVVDGLSNRRRREIHTRALAVLRARRSPATAAELARHALSGLPLTSREDAVALCRLAAAEAMQRYAYEDAAAHLDAAVEAAADQLDPARRREILVELGVARRAAGDIDHARDAFGAALDGDAELPGPLLATAALGYADPGADLGLAYGTDGPRSEILLQRALDALGPDEPQLRIRLLTRLGAQLYFSSRPEEARPLAEQAVALASRLGDPYSRVVAGLAHHDAYVVGYVPPDVALARSADLLRLARDTGDPHALLGAHRARIFDLIAAGDITGVGTEIEAFRREAAEVRVPAYEWWMGLWHAMQLLLEGDHERAESAAVQTYTLGERYFPTLAILNLGFMLFFLRREQSRLEEMGPMMDRYADTAADIPAIVPARAMLLAETGRLDEASGLVARVADRDFGQLRDRNWPVSWFQLARVAVLTGDRVHAATLYRIGRPLAGSCVMVSLGTVCLGAADLALGWLTETCKDPGAADWYARACATNARIGARSWLAEARLGAARRSASAGDTGAARRLAGLARSAAGEIGMPAVGAAADQILASLAAPPSSGRDGGVFRRDGALWELGYADRTVRIPHAKGLADLAAMLRQPGEPVHVSELVSAQAPDTEVAARSGDEVLDARARREIRSRLDALAADRDEAAAVGDAVRAARAKAERDELIHALTLAVGRDGRPRILGDGLERARKSVTARIRNSIRRIGEEHPDLARHLDRAVDTGVWCVYRPEHPVQWTL
ncbi:MAG TPA: AAA family ATPase [Trebonia sp.]|jgi:tetratricopeptide (TPR) repeat protein|nr:AAA family ATPase [Trebonia sp.]